MIYLFLLLLLLYGIRYLLQFVNLNLFEQFDGQSRIENVQNSTIIFSS